MENLPVLLAVGLDTIVQIVVVLFIMLSALANGLRRSGDEKPARPPQRRVPPQRQGQGKAPPQRQAPADPVRAEIERFLERAIQKRAPRPADPPRPLAAHAAPRPLAADIVEPEMIEPAAVLGRSLKEHVREHLETESLAARPPALGTRIEQADEMLESRLSDVFGHRVGRLAPSAGRGERPAVAEGTDSPVWSTPAAAASVPAVTGSELAALLRSGTSLKQAILLTEILRRPQDSW